jgi:hypothetical protein
MMEKPILDYDRAPPHEDAGTIAFILLNCVLTASGLGLFYLNLLEERSAQIPVSPILDILLPIIATPISVIGGRRAITFWRFRKWRARILFASAVAPIGLAALNLCILSRIVYEGKL